MPTPTRGPRLGGSPAHQRLMLGNLATELFRHERITTTEAKAKRLRPLAERMITFAKRGDLHARRQVLTVVRDRDVVHKLFDDIGARYEARPGGYTRIVKMGPRKGDNAPMAMIELVEPLTVAQQAVGEAERARRGAGATKAETKTKAETEAETQAETEPKDEAEADAESSDGPTAAKEAPESEEGTSSEVAEGESAETAEAAAAAEAVEAAGAAEGAGESDEDASGAEQDRTS